MDLQLLDPPLQLSLTGKLFNPLDHLGRFSHKLLLSFEVHHLQSHTISASEPFCLSNFRL